MDDEAGVPPAGLDLPDEVWVAVFGLLEPIHTAAVTLTCRRWRAVFHSDPPLWRAFHDRLLGGPLVPALLTAPAMPLNYPVHHLTSADFDASALGSAAFSGTGGSGKRHQRRLRRVEREAWFGADEWRAAVEWKVRRVRKWGVSPEGRLEWAARLGCTRLVATLLRRYWHELSITARASTAVTKALRAAACANDIESVERRTHEWAADKTYGYLGVPEDARAPRNKEHRIDPVHFVGRVCAQLYHLAFQVPEGVCPVTSLFRARAAAQHSPAILVQWGWVESDSKARQPSGHALVYLSPFRRGPCQVAHDGPNTGPEKQRWLDSPYPGAPHDVRTQGMGQPVASTCRCRCAFQIEQDANIDDYLPGQ